MCSRRNERTALRIAAAVYTPANSLKHIAGHTASRLVRHGTRGSCKPLCLYRRTRPPKERHIRELFDFQSRLAQRIGPGTVSGAALDGFVELLERVVVGELLGQELEVEWHFKRSGLARNGDTDNRPATRSQAALHIRT